MAKANLSQLTRRERQIFDVLFEKGEASAADVREGLPDPPSYSCVRAMLAKLEGKGQVIHRQDGPRYVYRATVPRSQARQKAMRQLVKTFFDGSASQAINGLLGMSAGKLSPEELRELADRIEQVRQEGR